MAASLPREQLPRGSRVLPAIRLQGVSKSFRDPRRGVPIPVLRDLSLEVPPGAFVTLLGPSGCGKTTLLRIVNGLLAPDSGEVQVLGDTPRPGPRMGFVFQSFRLLPWATVRRNIGFTLAVNGASREEVRARTDRYMELVRLSRFAESYPGHLSGGMKQRVALARALASEPEILLMDEPFASVDAQTRELMQFELMRLWSLRKCVVLFVTHSIDDAILLADTVVLLGQQPGRVLEIVEVPLPRPRWQDDVHGHPEFQRLRGHLWRRIRELVVSDPNSAFYGRPVPPAPR